ncbi:MAG: hypothetical protein Kow0077_28650 [Anaerolineae bacterium]
MTGIVRHPQPEEVSVIAGLINLCAVVRTGSLQITVGQLRALWASPGFELARDAWLLVGTDGLPLGYAELWRHPEGEPGPYMWLHVRPAPDAAQVAAVLLARVEAAVRAGLCEADHVALRALTAGRDQDSRRHFLQAGFHLADRRWMTLDKTHRSEAAHETVCVLCRTFMPHEEAGPQLWRYDVLEKDLVN